MQRTSIFQSTSTEESTKVEWCKASNAAVRKTSPYTAYLVTKQNGGWVVHFNQFVSRLETRKVLLDCVNSKQQYNTEVRKRHEFTMQITFNPNIIIFGHVQIVDVLLDRTND